MKHLNLKWKTTDEYIGELIKLKKTIDPVTFLKTVCQIQNESIDPNTIFLFYQTHEYDHLFSFSIHHTRLVELHVLPSIYDFDTCIRKLELIEKKDYIQLGDLFLLSPVTFKYCLFTSKYGKKYISQFSILEMIMQDYHKYIQTLHHEMTWNDVTLRKIIEECYKKDQMNYKKIYHDIHDLTISMRDMNVKLDTFLKPSSTSKEDQDEYDIV